MDLFQGTEGKYALVIGMSIDIMDVLQGTDGKYKLVIGMPIGIVENLYGTDGKNSRVAFSLECAFLSLHSTFFANARPAPSR